MKYLLLLFSVSFYGQQLHHQMLSSQGASVQTTDSFIITQTVGQQSSVGNSSNNYIVMQGFQQNLWDKYISSNKTDAVEDIKTITYPNPFLTSIHFQFSKIIQESINITIFDVSGRLIYQGNKTAVNTVLTLDLSKLPSSEYLIRLNTDSFNYYTKIIKQ